MDSDSAFYDLIRMQYRKQEVNNSLEYQAV